MEREEQLKLVAKFGQRIEQLRCRVRDLKTALGNCSNNYFPETYISIGNGKRIWIEGASCGTRNAWRQMLELEIATVDNEIDMDCDSIEALLRCMPAETKPYILKRIEAMAE